MELLLEHGAAVSETDRNGETPLHQVADMRQAPQGPAAAMATLLLDLGADPNARNWDDVTPLHQAVCANHADVVRLLVERRARLDIRDTIYQGTPLGWAIYCEKPALAEYLRAQDAPAS